MRAQIRSDGVVRRLMLVVFACALALRLGVPAGWMPAAHAGAIRIALCNNYQGSGASDAAQALLDAALPQPSGENKARPDQPCAFAGLGAPLAELGGIAPIAAPWGASDTAPRIAHRAIAPGRGLAAPPPPATGPPAFA